MSFWRKKPKKIEVFVRYCYYSEASAHKGRFERFSHEKCFKNLLQTVDTDLVNLTFLLDVHHQKGPRHFVLEQSDFPVVEINAGVESKAFLQLLEHVAAQNFSEDTPIYFLEDDYLHKPEWAKVLLEGLSVQGADYVTLFDHRDKYEHPDYVDLRSQIFFTSSCHWRETPSTTNTYAMHFGTLLRDLEIHKEYSTDCRISRDHDKFIRLGLEGKRLISSLPGWATHAEPPFASPCFEWSRFF